MKSVVAYTDTVIVLVKCSDNKLHLESIELKKDVVVEIPQDTILIYSPNNVAVINTGSECAFIAINDIGINHYKNKDSLGMISNLILEDIIGCESFYANDPHFKTAKVLVKSGVELYNLSGDTYTLYDKGNLPPNYIVSEIDSSKLCPDIVNSIVLGIYIHKFSVGALMLEESIPSVVYKIKGEDYFASSVKLYNDTLLDEDVSAIVCTKADASKIKSSPVPVVAVEDLTNNLAMYKRIKHLKESGKLEESDSHGDVGYVLVEGADYKLDKIVKEELTKRHEFNVDDIATDTSEDNLRERGTLLDTTVDDPKRMSLSMPHMAFDSTPVNHCLECSKTTINKDFVESQAKSFAKDGYWILIEHLSINNNLTPVNNYTVMCLLRLMTENMEIGEKWSEVYGSSLALLAEQLMVNPVYDLESGRVQTLIGMHGKDIIKAVLTIQRVSGLNIIERLIELDENYF